MNARLRMAFETGQTVSIPKLIQTTCSDFNVRIPTAKEYIQHCVFAMNLQQSNGVLWDPLTYKLTD